MADPAFKKILSLLEGESGEQRMIRFWAKVDKASVDDCWEWTGSLDGSGYGRFKIASYHQARAHRVALIASSLEEPPGMLVLHHCDNRKCVNPEHLYFGTVQDNANDKVRRGRCVSGDHSGFKNANSKLDEKQLALVVIRLQDGWSNKQIAADLPITHSMVSLIRLGRMWRKQTEALGYEPKACFVRKSA